MKKFFLSIVFLSSFCLLTVQAQFDAQFSQNMFNIPAVNPAAIAVDSSFSVYALNRQQWVGLKNAPKTTVVNASIPFYMTNNSQHAAGVLFSNDKLGFFLNQSIYGQYAYRFKMRQSLISVGMVFGVLNQTFDPSDMYIPDDFELTGLGGMNDPAVLKSKANALSFDLGFGAFYSDPHKYIGISAQHLTKPKLDLDDNIVYSVKTTTYFTAGYNFFLANPLYVLKPSVFVKTDFVSLQSDFNLLLEYNKKYWGGLGYRLDDAVVFLVGMELISGLRISYSYDWTTSKLRSVSDGSHEVMLGYRFKPDFRKKNKYKSIRIL